MFGDDMSKIKITLQAGPVFYDVFHGFLRIAGTNLKDWSLAHGLHGNNVKAAATGVWNGPAARELRQQMIDWVGADLFERLYEERLTRESAEAA